MSKSETVLKIFLSNSPKRVLDVMTEQIPDW